MAQEGGFRLLAPGSWASIGLIYLYGVLSSASLSKVIPILGDVGAHLGASPAQLGTADFPDDRPAGGAGFGRRFDHRPHSVRAARCSSWR